jgi:hypothetical protein
MLDCGIEWLIVRTGCVPNIGTGNKGTLSEAIIVEMILFARGDVLCDCSKVGEIG